METESASTHEKTIGVCSSDRGLSREKKNQYRKNKTIIVASYGNSSEALNFFFEADQALNFLAWEKCPMVAMCACVSLSLSLSLSRARALSLSLSLSLSLFLSVSLCLSLSLPVLDELEEGRSHGGHDIEAAHPQPEHKQEKGPVVAVSYTLYVSLV